MTSPTPVNAQLDSDELKMLRELVRRFVADELIPLEREVQEREAQRGLSAEPVIPPEAEKRLMSRAKELDLWGIDVPVEYGGQGLGIATKLAVVEELNRSIVPFRLPPETPNLFLLEQTCTEEQRQRYLLPYAQGHMRSALALSEPGAGSDAANISTRARWASGGWVLDGAKTWISFADKSDFFIVIAVTDSEKRARGGMTAFLVDRETPGFTIGKATAMMGEARTWDLFFDDCFVPDANVLGEIGYAFKPLTNRLGVRRVEIASRCVGMAERLLELMSRQAIDRVTFGQPLADRQAVQFWIADSAIEVHAARLMVQDAAAKLEAGVADIRTEASATKVFATEMITRVADRAMQLYGGSGYTKELPIEWIYRYSRMFRIVEGPSEIHRVQIAKGRLNAAKSAAVH